MAGIFDPALKRRAPVDQLFAGRKSLLIPDEDWDRDVGLAIGAAEDELSRRYIDSVNGAQGGRSDRLVRDRIYDDSGLLAYPGEVVGKSAVSPDQMTFMREFSDEGARMKGGWGHAKTLGEALDHPLLYQHYPHMADMNFSAFNEGHKSIGDGRETLTHGHWNPSTETISLNLMGDDPLGTLLHEAQHAIQEHEGWSNGANSDYLSPSGGYFSAFDKYLNKDGEILAREVVNRLDDTKQADSVIEAAEYNLAKHRGRDVGWVDSVFGMMPAGVQNLNRDYVDRKWAAKNKEKRLIEALEEAREIKKNVGRYPNKFTVQNSGNALPWGER